jgi:EmrB/QacA subfamily drug resistance transporter
VSGLSLDRRRALTLAACVIGSSMAFIDATVVIVAMPTIEQDLGLGLSGQEWLFLSYSLALASLYLFAGAVGDRLGRRTTFSAGVAAFAVASAIAGAAPDGAVLIAARALQGIGGAFLTTNSLALLRAVYGDQAGRAIGLWTAFTSVSTIIGPPVGGAIVEWTSWRWIFYLNLPLAVITIGLAHLGRCEERGQRGTRKLDVPGAILAATGFGLVTFAMVEGADRGFSGYWWAFLGGATALVAFVFVERRVAEPMLPFALFKGGNFAAANAETFVTYAAIYGYLVFFTLYLQTLGFSPFEAGLISTPSSIILVLFATRFGTLADKHGPRLYLTLGPALIGAGALLSIGMTERSDLWTFGIASLGVFSFGLAVLVAPITSTALKSAPTEFAGIASGVNSTLSRLGSLTSVAVIGLVISLVFASSTDVDADPLSIGQTGEALAGSIDAYRAGMMVTGVLALAGALIGAFWISNHEARGETATQPQVPAAEAGS